jgi:hypothetical protein
MPKRQSRYYRLPKVLMDLIWSYDDRYIKQFKPCVHELLHYFNHNRLMNRLNSEKDLFSLYMTMQRKVGPRLYRITHNFNTYILEKKRIFGDPALSDNLKCCQLKRLPIENTTNITT